MLRTGGVNSLNGRQRLYVMSNDD